MFAFFTCVINILGDSRRWDCVTTVRGYCGAAMRVTKISMLGTSGDSRMGTEIRMLLCRCTVCDVHDIIGDQGYPTGA